MAQTIVAFRELLDRLPGVSAAAQEVGFELAPADNGRDALFKAQTLHPAIVLIDVAMPQMSGIECCRQIKVSAIGVAPAVVLFSAVGSEVLEERAKEAGCDLFAIGGADVEQAVVSLVKSRVAGNAPSTPPPADLVRRVDERVEIPGPMEYAVGSEAKAAELVNASQSGVLFSAAEAIAIDTPIEMRFRTAEGTAFALPGVVVRSMPLKAPAKSFAFANGARFGVIAPEDKGKVDWLLAGKQGHALPRVTTDVARSVLEATPELIVRALAGQGDPVVISLLGEVSAFERAAHGSDATYADCVRRLTLSRLQCNVFHAFVPVLQKEIRVLGLVFLPLFSALLHRCDEIETDTENHVRQAVAKGDESTRQGLNESSNRLHEGRVKVLYALDESMPREGLGSEGKVLENVRARVQKLRELRAGIQDDLKYSRRAPPPAPKKEEKGKSKAVSLVLSKKVLIPVGSLGLVSIVSAIYSFATSFVSSAALSVPLPVQSAYVEEEGLIVKSTPEAWDRLTNQEREATYSGIELYIRNNKLRQAKIVSPEDRNIAALIPGGGSNLKREFVRRNFR